MKKNIEKRKYNISLKLFLISFAYLYPLLALDRIKKISFFYVDGFRTTNEIWILLGLSSMLIIVNSLIKKTKFKKNNTFFWILYYILLIVIVAGAFNINSTAQYIYAVLIFIVPILFFLLISDLEYDLIQAVIKLIVISTLVYSIFAIILTTNYAFFMSLVGNSIDNYRFYSQYRASMMIGSSITVSYYFNLTLPLCLYVYETCVVSRWKRISLIAIISNLMATFLLLSRLATLSSIITIFCYIFFMSKKKRNFKKNILFLLTFFASMFYTINNYDISRLIIGMNLNGTSAFQRFAAGNLGLNIFYQSPLLGSGMGVHFKRLYENRFISYNGLTGLIDPHNMYILIMSEIGLIGLVVFLTIILLLFFRFRLIKDSTLRKISFITLTIMMINSIGGSHIVNEISFSTIFWIIISLFNNAAIQSKFADKSGVLK